MTDAPTPTCVVAHWIADHADATLRHRVPSPAPPDALPHFVVESGAIVQHALRDVDDVEAIAILTEATEHLRRAGGSDKALQLTEKLVSALLVDDLPRAVAISWLIAHSGCATSMLGRLVGDIIRRIDGGGADVRSLILPVCSCDGSSESRFQGKTDSSVAY